MDEEQDIIKAAQLRAEEIIAEARKERQLILEGTGSISDLRKEIEKFCLSPEQYSYLREFAEKWKDKLTIKMALRENKRQQKYLTELPGNATDYERNPSIPTFGMGFICGLVTDYFDLLFDGLAKNVMKTGLDRSMKELIHLQKSVELTMSLGSKMKFKDEFMILKMEELELKYKLELAKEQEKEWIRGLKERRKEEMRAQKEYERELKRAQKDEEAARDALKRARQLSEVEAEGSKERARLQAKIEKLEQALQEAQSRAERAMSMAQQTRCGYVYVISNIGSFGEGVYKIGMTRRLDPMERVTELGDASVPFPFDVHAMIYSEDAPALESALHRAFENHKLNMVNGRKEFFRVTLKEIKQKVAESGIDAEFLDEPTAQQWRDSQMFAEELV